MVDERTIAELHRPINKLEKYANDNITPCPGRNVYYDTLDAVEICRGRISEISELTDNLTYVKKVIRALKTARDNYRYIAVDDGGYGISTFHEVIRDATALYESLGGREEDLESEAGEREAELLYLADDPWERCFRAFALADFIGCAIEAEKIVLEKSIELRREILLLLLISLQRTWRSEMAEDLAKTLMIPANYNEPWLTALIELTIGTASADEVAAKAESDEQLCQFNFYHGARLSTDRQEAEARAAFKACAEAEADCDERYLALVELSSDNRAPVVSIYQLALRSKRAEAARDETQAAALAADAYELARRHLGDEDPVTQSLALRVAFL
ncbi:MAG TPA: hypothetical protein VGC76_10515 [Pyrinomonadaceae bacterium]|jgi:hypothetical protein